MATLQARYAKVPPRMRYGLVGAALAALPLAFVMGVHGGQADALAERSDRRAALADKLSERRAMAAHLPQVEAHYAELTQALGAARALLPDNPDVPQFLAQLGNTAREVGLVVERFEPREETYQDFYAEIAFGMEVHGTYHEIATFIDQVGHFDRIVNIGEISMTAPHTENQKVVLHGTFVVKTFRFISDALAAELAAKKEAKK